MEHSQPHNLGLKKKKRRKRLPGGPGPRGSAQRKEEAAAWSLARPNCPSREPYKHLAFRGSPHNHDKGSGESPVLGLSFPICTVGTVDQPQLPSPSFDKQASVSPLWALVYIGIYDSLTDGEGETFT